MTLLLPDRRLWTPDREVRSPRMVRFGRTFPMAPNPALPQRGRPYFDTFAGTSSTSTPATLTVTPTISGNLCVAVLSTYTYIPMTGVTCGGVAMNHVGGSNNYGGTGNGGIEMWALFGPPHGAQNVVATQPSSKASSLFLVALTYFNVRGLGAGVTVIGTATNTTPSQPNVASVTNGLVIQAFSAFGALSNAQFSAYAPGTARYIPAPIGSSLGIVAGDAPGAPTVSFTATTAASTDWSGVALPVY